MGFLQWAAAGILAKSGHNKFNPPQVTVPPGLEMVGCKARGMNEYTIKYRDSGSKGGSSQFTVSRNSRSHTGKNGVDWEFHWS